MRRTKTEGMTYKERAHRIQYEWIINEAYRVCLRPMLFDDDGIRQTRYYPDPVEFVPLLSAVHKLEDLEAQP